VSGVTGEAAQAVVEFRPRKRLQVPWDLVLVGAGALLGLALALAGAAALAGRPLPVLPVPKTRGLDVLAVAFLVGAGPYAVVQTVARARLLARDSRLPDFLTDLASLHKAGLTLPDSLVTTAQGNYGPLNDAIRQAADQVRWNIPVLTALENLQKRIGTPVSERIFAVVLEAGRTGGNVPEVLEIAAGHCRRDINLRDQRRRAMSMYTIITYVASVIFVGVCIALQAIFVPKMIHAFSGAGAALGLKVLPTAEQFRTLFYSAALVQSLGNGFIAGLMSDGKLLAGLKHGWMMVLLTVLGFLMA